jgi:hypothetical protein
MRRNVKTKGTLGCLVHDTPFHCAEIELRTEGASRRFLLYCPVRGCENGFRMTVSDFMQVQMNAIESDNRSRLSENDTGGDDSSDLN